MFYIPEFPSVLSYELYYCTNLTIVLCIFLKFLKRL